VRVLVEMERPGVEVEPKDKQLASVQRGSITRGRIQLQLVRERRRSEQEVLSIPFASTRWDRG
jgi:hypothetical protein